MECKTKPLQVVDHLNGTNICCKSYLETLQFNKLQDFEILLVTPLILSCTITSTMKIVAIQILKIHYSLLGCSNFLYPKHKFGKELAIKETDQKQD